MRVLIFGASGGTGRELTTQALAAGHSVTVFVRDPATAPEPDRVQVVQGDVLDAASVAASLAGQDAVLSALGARSLAKSDLLERAITNILAGMKAQGVRRLIVLGASGALHDPNRYQSLTRKMLFAVLKNTMLKYPMRDSAAQERLIEASDVEYTVVHPPRLLDTPFTGKYRVQVDGLPPNSGEIARADVADFMVKQLVDRTFVHGGPYIAY